MAYSKTPEGKIKKRGREICKKLGIYYFPVNQGGLGRTGIPDDVLCVNGRFVHIEYKAHMDWTKRTKTAFKTLPTNLQVKRMEECRASGGFTMVVDDTNIEYLEDELKAIMEKKVGIYFACGWAHTLEELLEYKGEIDADRS